MADKITVEKQDVIKSIYFIAEMVQNSGEKGMYGGLAGKSDLMGGIFDRWINQIPESVIFNKYILPTISQGKEVEIITDFYKYVPRQETTGIAPDVIGLKINDKIIPFVVYDNRWLEESGKPQIEVKTFKSSQKMVSLRNQGYNGKYLVMIESDFRVDYLLPFFDKTYFGDDVYEKMTMNDDIFIKNNNGYIHHLKKIDNTRQDLGAIKLLCITETSLFINIANYCGPGISPIRIDSISGPIEKNINSSIDIELLQYCELQDSGLYRFNKTWSEETMSQYLDFACSDISAIRVVKKNKSNFYIKALSNCYFNYKPLEEGRVYKIGFMELNRKGSSEGEYFLQKDLICDVISKEQELKDILAKIIIEER